MSLSSPAIKRTLSNESGVPIENDNGRGLSVWGITFATVKALGLTWTEDDLRNISYEAASRFYERYFWIPSGVGKIEDQGLANVVFDLGVNMGMKNAVRLLQRAVRVKDEDGLLGLETQAAVNSAVAKDGADVVIERLKTIARERYQTLAVVNPKNRQFLAGWLNRLNKPTGQVV